MESVDAPTQWAKRHFTVDMGLSESELDEMRTTVEEWLFTNPIPGGLRYKRNRTIVQQYVSTQLEPKYRKFFRQSPKGDFAVKAPYGFVAWVFEASNAKVKTESGTKRGSTEPSAPLSLPHLSIPQPVEQFGLGPHEFDWLWITAFSVEGEEGMRARVSLEAILVDPPSGVILSAKVAVRHASYDSLMSCINDRSLLRARRLALIAREDPSFADTSRRQLIDSSSLLKEAIRYMLEVRGRLIEFWVVDAASKVVVEDLLTRPIPPPVSNAPPTFNAPSAPTLVPDSTTAPTPRKRTRIPSPSKVPPKPSLLIKLNLPKQALARLKTGKEDAAVVGQDEDEPPHKQTRRSTRLTRAPIYTPTPSDTSDSEGFEADSSVYQAYDAAEDLGHSNNIEMSDELPMNPMFDPAAKPMEDLTGEGNRDLAEEERDDDEVLYHLVEKLTNHSMLSQCEVLQYWEAAAASIKADPKALSSDPCVRLPELKFLLFQYQWLGVYVSFMMCLSDRNGVILADEMGMGKTLQTIALIVLLRYFILNCREVDHEWDHPPKEADARKHYHRDGSGRCSVDKDSWFTCACIPGTPHYGLRPTDGHFEILAPPGMLGTWLREWTKFYLPADPASQMELVLGHGSLGKGTATFSQQVTLADNSVCRLSELLTGPIPSLPAAPEGDEHCHYREVNGRWVLQDAPTGPYLKSSPRFDSSRLVVVSSHQSWSTHVDRASPEHVYAYTNTEKGAKYTYKRFRTITPGMIIVDEAHTCTSSSAGHYKVMNQIAGMTFHTIKKVLLSGTPIRKGPGDIIAMIEAMESAAWKQPGHFLHGLTAANLKVLNKKFLEVKSIDDDGMQDIINGIAGLMPLVAIRRTNESKWFGLPLRPPIEAVKLVIEVGFPDKYRSALGNLRERVIAELNQSRTLDGDIDKTQMSSMTRLYRMTSNAPFFAEFWSKPGNAQYKFLAEDMKDWLDEDGNLSSDCPLARHAAEIRANSPKLDFIGSILDTMTDPTTGKLMIVTDFVASAWTVFDYVTHHPSKQSALLYHSGLSRKTREAMYEGFQEMKKLDDVTGTKLTQPKWNRRVWIGTIKTMGLGLTLTAADKVVVLEPNMMPTDEAQAIARAIRIGQTKKVFVNRLVCPTIGIEDKILNTNKLRDFLVTRAFVG